FYAAGLVGFAAALYLARDLRQHGRSVAVLVVGAVATSAWWFIRNWQLYGEVIPSRTVAAAKASAGGNTLYIPIDHGINLLTISKEMDFWEVTLKSFVAAFGFLSIYLDPPYYAAAVVIAILGLVGIAWHVRSEGLTMTG